ncbi:MAG: uroporphyrinogen-III synthase [Alphaproteobacteria bacterium]|nr:MAG: uroporphyrinogen-III synthase [Alphaproteobacteria bacterium]
MKTRLPRSVDGWASGCAHGPATAFSVGWPMPRRHRNRNRGEGRMRILVTRPADRAEALAERLRAMGHAPLVAPTLEIEACDAPPPEGASRAAALIATSPRAFLGAPLPPALRARPLHAVGPASAAAAREAGFEHVEQGPSDGGALAERIIARHAPAEGPLLYLAGHHRRGDLERALRSAGFELMIWERYRAVRVATPPPDLARALASGALDLALFHSARSAEVFADWWVRLGRPDLSMLVAVGLSPTVLVPLGDLGLRDRLAVEVPREEALLKRLANLYGEDDGGQD